MITKFYDKRESVKDRKYYDSLNDLFVAKGIYIGKYIIPSWLGIKNIEVDI